MATSTETYSAKYARAFLKALDKADAKQLLQVEKELAELSILSEEPLLGFFANPVFHLDEKVSVLNDMFAQSKIQEETKQLLLTLLSLNHVQFIGEIAKNFSTELREKYICLVHGDPERALEAARNERRCWGAVQVGDEDGTIGGLKREVRALLIDPEPGSAANARWKLCDDRRSRVGAGAPSSGCAITISSSSRGFVCCTVSSIIARRRTRSWSSAISPIVTWPSNTWNVLRS